MALLLNFPSLNSGGFCIWAIIDKFCPDRRKHSCIFASDKAISKFPSFCLVGADQEIIIDEMRIFEKRAKENNIDVDSYYVPGKHLESENSKVGSGYTFWLISKKYFAAFSQQNLETIHLWLTHQSKALIFYFELKNILTLILGVCKHTRNLIGEIHLSVSHKLFKNEGQNFCMSK